MHYAQDHLHDIVKAEFEARDKLAELFVTIADIELDRANSLVDFYIRKKMAKLDRPMRRYSVSHGAYLDRDFIEFYATRGAF